MDQTMEEFYAACKNDDMLKIVALIPNIDASYALRWCSQAGLLNVTKLLLASGARPSKYSMTWSLLNEHYEIFNLQKICVTIDIYVSVLKASVKMGNARIVSFVFAEVGDHDAIRKMYQKLIKISIKKKHVHILIILLEIEQWDPALLQTSIACAVKRSNYEITKLLIEYFDSYSCDRDTLIEAASENNENIVELLLKTASIPIIIEAFIEAARRSYICATVTLLAHLPSNCDTIYDLVDELIHDGNLIIITIIIAHNINYIRNARRHIKNMAESKYNEMISALLPCVTVIDMKVINILIMTNNLDAFKQISINYSPLLSQHTIDIVRALIDAKKQNSYASIDQSIILWLNTFKFQASCDLLCELIENNCVRCQNIVVDKRYDEIKEILNDCSAKSKIIEAFTNCENKTSKIAALLINCDMKINRKIIKQLIKCNNIGAIGAIVEHGTDIISSFVDGCTTDKLILQILSGKACSMLNLLLNCGQQSCDKIMRPLIKTGNDKIIKKILNSEAILVLKSDNIWKIFFDNVVNVDNIASIDNAMVKLFLTNGLSISKEYINKFMNTKNIEIIKFIVERRPDLVFSFATLESIIEVDNHELIRALAKQSENAQTMLRIAVHRKKMMLIQFLLDLGIDPKEIFMGTSIFGYSGASKEDRVDKIDEYIYISPTTILTRNVVALPEDIDLNKQRIFINKNYPPMIPGENIVTPGLRTHRQSIYDCTSESINIKMIILLVQYGADPKYLNSNVLQKYSKYLVSEKRDLAELLFSALNQEDRKRMLSDEHLRRLQMVETKNARNV